MPGGHSLFGTRASQSQAPRPHSAAAFPGGSDLLGGSGDGLRPLGPENTIVASWVRLDAKPAANQVIVKLGLPGAPAGNPVNDVLGVFYDHVADAFRAFVCNGVAYQIFPTAPEISPTIGLWYLVQVEFGSSAVQVQVDKPDGTTVGGFTGLTIAYNTLANVGLSIGANGDASESVLGALDSVQYWNSTRIVDHPAYFGSPGEIWNAGKALDFDELPASAPPSSVLQVYLNFNEPTGARQYADSSPNHFAFERGGGVLTRIPGAGY